MNTKTLFGDRRHPLQFISLGSLFAILYCGLFLTQPCFAQDLPPRGRGLTTRKAISVRTDILPLDRVYLKSGKKYYGIVRSDHNGEMEFLVERKWLQKKYKTKYKEVEAEEKQRLKKIKETYIDRIDQWVKEIKDDPDSMDLIYLLKDQKQKIIDMKDDALPLFCSLKFQKNKIRKTKYSPPAAKRVAGIAWKHQIELVGDKKIRTLLAELKKKGVEVKTEQFDHSGEVISELPSEQQWKMKQAILRYELVKSHRYQNVGEEFFGEGQPLQLKDVMATFMKSLSIENLIGDIADDLPEFRHLANQRKKKATDPKWWTGIQKKLEKEWEKSDNLDQPTGVFISRQSPASNTKLVKIQSVFVVRLKDGKWLACQRFESSATPQDVTKAQMDLLQEDPRIKKVLDLGKSLGGGDSKINQALRFGAMVQIASQKNKETLTKFVELHTNHIQAPIQPSK